MPLRLKLLIAVIVLVLAGLAVADVVTYTALRSFLLKRVDQQLLAARQPVALVLSNSGPIDPFPTRSVPESLLLPPGTTGEVIDSSGDVVARRVFTYGVASPPQPDLSSLSETPGTFGEPVIVTTDSVGRSRLRYRVLAQPVRIQPSGEPGTFVVAIPLTEVGQTLARLIRVELLITAVIVVALAVVSWWLVRRELRPLEEIETTAGAIAAGDLARRVEERDPRTEIGRLGVALNAMLAQIEQAFWARKASEERLRRFLADASHELRTPLTSIRGYAELFRRGAHGHEADLAKSMRRIEEESRRMGLLVEELLLLARLGQDRPLQRGPVDLAALAADAVADTRAVAPDHPISLEASGAVPVTGDEARLRQLAANLLSNAVTHTPAGTPVTVRTFTEDHGGVLEVADRGPGIPESDAGRVFEPFFRSDPSRDRATGGAGLGLAIVRAIAEAHGGTVEVAATPGGGTTFRVRIPMETGDGMGSSAPEVADTSH